MRTNIEIDDRLMAKAMKASGKKSKRETVEEALRQLVESAKYRKILALRGKVRWEGDLEAMRRDK